MRLYNTLTGRVEDFVPRGALVTMYVCGVTPYDTTHVGHAFTYVVFDVLARYLRFVGQQVRYVQNVTDVDDDILRRAAELGVGWRELAARETARYLEDMAALNVEPADVYPRASAEVAIIITMIEGLLSEGLAYVSDGNVYFRVHNYPAYGQLSRLSYEQMLPIANERGNYPDDPRKAHPLDFVLWQESAPGEPYWDSPWSSGRPGWHIECSAMSMKYLGEQIDIHGGGSDLIFPHHESEIAQSEGYSHRHPFVRYWLHTGMVHHSGEKMSKSLGNMVMVRGVLRDVPADALRLYLLSHHYRDSWDYDENGPARMAQRAAEIRSACTGSGRAPRPHSGVDAGAWVSQFMEAMETDLNTPKAIEATLSLARDVSSTGSPDQNVEEDRRALDKLVGLLGLTLDESPPYSD